MLSTVDKRKIQDIHQKYLSLKDKNCLKFFEYLPSYLLDLWTLGVINKFSIPINTEIILKNWEKILNTLEKNEKKGYNYKKILLGFLVYFGIGILTKIKNRR